MTTQRNQLAPKAVILAAGKGTRMKSDLPKVCHPVGGRAMVCAVVDACLDAGCDEIVVVVGYQQEKVREALSDYADSVSFAVQDEQLGTGHAVMSSDDQLRAFAEQDPATPVFVLCGDGPLIRAQTLARMLEVHATPIDGKIPAATLATSVLDDASGYGRIVRDAAGRFERIVEQKNATASELEIREVNPSYYCFGANALRTALAKVTRNELTGEYYITDAPALLMDEGERVAVIAEVPAEDVLSINTPEHLAEVDRLFRSRVTRRGATAGTTGGHG